MTDLVIRISPSDATDTDRLKATLSQRLPQLDGVEDVEIEAVSTHGERLDPTVIVTALGGITLVVGAARLTVGEARKLLEEIKEALVATNGIKEATLQLVGRKPVPIDEATAEQVAEESAGP